MRKWLKDKREELGLSKSDMAAGMGISLSGYCLIEDGLRQKSMDINTAFKLAGALKMPVLDVMYAEVQEEA